MSDQYAENFFEIPNALTVNNALPQFITDLIGSESIPGKVLEDDNGDRLGAFRDILIDLVNGKIVLETAYQQTELKLPRHTSSHSSNSRVFPDRWAERLIRTQLSRFYNQAVLEQLLEKGAEKCFVPHSDEEDPSSACTQQVAGKQHPVSVLYERLIDNYSKGNWSRDVKIPNHPYCTHVVKPVSEND